MEKEIGFSSKINEYLNHYVGVADAKAAGLITTSLTLIGFDYVIKPDNCSPLPIIASVTFYALCVLIGIVTLYPRLESKGTSLIFWEDVQAKFKTPEKYHDVIKKQTPRSVEKEFTYQNFFVSRILHRKYRTIRICSVLFLIGLVFTIASIFLY